MMGDAIKLLYEKAAGRIDARDTERATLLSWPNPKIEVDGDPYPYESESLVFADYLQEREIEVTFDVIEPAPTMMKGKLLIPSPLEVGDRLLVSRMTGQRYYVLGKER
ncbi:hypothetical protein DC345_30150 [Paenibacillus taichungensis]|uniref:DUF2577 domain-containing protein n=1 Tax=Paenibacillus taichungensis TaxID=484184 RepID=A0A329QBJ7_9BACL|nr:DUF2577 family protein [Paenibacillus taichungensis]RAW09726.1 hypothetical protein DC345_30150 [Paenibacillus taichungensis]